MFTLERGGLKNSVLYRISSVIRQAVAKGKLKIIIKSSK